MAKYSVPALEKAIAILDLIASSEKHYTITEIHKTLDISKATVFTILNVLEAHDIVKKNDKGEYEIGVKLYQLGMSYISKVDIVKIARPYLEALMEETGYTVHLGVLDSGELLYVDKVEPDAFIKFSTFPGMRSEIHITSLGKAISAFLDEAELDKIISEKGLSKHTPHTMTDAQEFKQSLVEIRKNGYAIEDEEGEIGVRCIGAPIFSNDGRRVVAAVSVASHTSSLHPDSFAEVAKKVKNTAKAISKELGIVGGNRIVSMRIK